jgi:hypothetical protein
MGFQLERWFRGALPLVALLWMSTAPAAAQSPTTVGSTQRAAASACTYDQCALRLEESSIRQGVEGRLLGDLSVFSTISTSVPWFNDSARTFARRAQSGHTQSTVVRALGAVSYIAGIVVASRAVKEGADRASGTGTTSNDAAIKQSEFYTGLGLELGGAVLGWVAEGMERRARSMLSRAVWWHNRDVSR